MNNATAVPRFRVQDAAGLRRIDNWAPVSDAQTVSETIDELAAALGLPWDDGRTVYSARRESDGMSLFAADRLLDAVTAGETIVLEPDAMAG